MQKTLSEMPAGEADNNERFDRYSRANPTPHYRALLNFYQQMHSQGYQQLRGGQLKKKAPEESFPGKKTLEFRDVVKSLVDHFGATSLFDYGAGKGGHYSETTVITDSNSGEQYFGLKDYWGLESVTTWEPGLEQPAPEGKHDAVICVDVLEHCFLGDIFWIVDELFSLADQFVFANVACYPAKAILPNGNNVHTLVRKPQWWYGVFDAVASRHPGVDYYLCCAVPNPEGGRGLKWFQRQPIEPSVVEETNFER